MSWLLDADVLSQSAKAHPSPKVIKWLRQERSSSYTSSVVIAQLAHWVQTKEGSQRRKFEEWFAELLENFYGRIYGFNTSVAIVWAELFCKFERTGKRMPLEDSYIAATALRYGLTIATGNEKDFRRPGLQVFNPFRE